MFAALIEKPGLYFKENWEKAKEKLSILAIFNVYIRMNRGALKIYRVFSFKSS